MEYIFLIVIFLGIIIYEIIDRYFDYKEKDKKKENNEK